ncbi:MerR family transcriptional regulator [Kiloniella sp. EL199]|uniref:MerR family transcriptional regulator n=1 Tax=Kiloniella sp. EL199 TaxID=2107581 RepID=UPI000EA081E2|nr:MerR family transcriptional regulator [Kiloniella sp. EL199]
MCAAETSSKSAAAFRTISEVSGDLDVPQHVLRFWETKFPQVKPLKRAGRRRYYRPEDLKILRQIKDLLYKDGYTIKGVQKLFKEGALKANASLDEEKSVPKRTTNEKKTNNTNDEKSLVNQVLGLSPKSQKEVLDELKSIRALLG